MSEEKKNKFATALLSHIKMYKTCIENMFANAAIKDLVLGRALQHSSTQEFHNFQTVES